MKIYFYRYGSICEPDVIDSFKRLGLDVDEETIEISNKNLQQQQLIDAMKKIHQYAIMCSPTTAQFAAIEALKNGDESVSEMVKEYNRRRRVLVDGFRKLGFECFEPLGAFYVFPSIKKTGLTSMEFCNRLLQEQKVAVIPGDAFGNCAEGYIRCSYAYSKDIIKKCLEKIAVFVSQFDLK